MKRRWSELDKARLRREWFGHNLFELSDMFDRSERSVASVGHELGLTVDDYACAMARNDAQTIFYCRLLLDDNEWGFTRIADHLSMSVSDVYAIHNQMKKDSRHARLC